MGVEQLIAQLQTGAPEPRNSTLQDRLAKAIPLAIAQFGGPGATRAVQSTFPNEEKQNRLRSMQQRMLTDRITSLLGFDQFKTTERRQSEQDRQDKIDRLETSKRQGVADIQTAESHQSVLDLNDARIRASKISSRREEILTRQLLDTEDFESQSQGNQLEIQQLRIEDLKWSSQKAKELAKIEMIDRQLREDAKKQIDDPEIRHLIDMGVSMSVIYQSEQAKALVRIKEEAKQSPQTAKMYDEIIKETSDYYIRLVNLGEKDLANRFAEDFKDITQSGDSNPVQRARLTLIKEIYDRSLAFDDYMVTAPPTGHKGTPGGEQYIKGTDNQQAFLEDMKDDLMALGIMDELKEDNSLSRFIKEHLIIWVPDLKNRHRRALTPNDILIQWGLLQVPKDTRRSTAPFIGKF